MVYPAKHGGSGCGCARPGAVPKYGFSGIDNGDPKAAGMVAEYAIAAGVRTGLRARSGQARELAKCPNIDPEVGVGRVKKTTVSGSWGCSAMGGSCW
jgi:hypothetical protein